MSLRTRTTDAEALQARLGGAVAAALNSGAVTLPHDLTERLRASREQALARARSKAVPAGAAAPAVVVGVAGGAAVLGHGPREPLWPWKLASALPLLVLLAGLVLIDRWNDLQQVKAAAEIDALLLADDLPPAAYADPGFGEFLRSPGPDRP